MASHAKQVKGDDPNKRDNLVLQIRGWSWGYNPFPENTCSVEMLLSLERKGYGPPRAVMPEEEKNLYLSFGFMTIIRTSNTCDT